MPRNFHLRSWIAAAVLLFVPTLLSAQQASRVVGRIIAAKVVGTVMVTDSRAPMKPFRLVERGEVTESQIINTGEDSRVLLVFSNGATVNVGAKSTLAIEEFLQDPFSQPIKVSELVDEPTTSTTKLNLIRGEMMSNVKHLRREKGSSFSVQTPVGAAGIRGTTFQIVYRASGNVGSYALRMVEGKIALDFGGRSKNIDVEKDQQVVLDGISLDASGRVVALPSSIKLSDIPESLKASLSAAAQSLSDAAAVINFPPLRAAESPQQAFPQSGGSSDSSGSGPDATTPSGASSSSLLPLSPVPPAVPPAPRTTPGDGQA
ncbi:MAG: FecR family protein [Nibricoccus sp.]